MSTKRPIPPEIAEPAIAAIESQLQVLKDAMAPLPPVDCVLSGWTLDEVARAIDHLPLIVLQAKETWPGAKVVERAQRSRGVLDDPIPF